jgi:HEPN domain-containing protein
MPERSRDGFLHLQHDLEIDRLELQWRHFEWVCFPAHQGAEKVVRAVYYKTALADRVVLAKWREEGGGIHE